MLKNTPRLGIGPIALWDMIMRNASYPYSFFYDNKCLYIIAKWL